MRCREYRSELIELARGGEARRGLSAHVESCAECARFLDDQVALTAALQAVAAESERPGMALEARVMAEFPEPRMPVWRWAAAAGVALAACASAFWMLRDAPVSQPAAATVASFVTIPYTVPLAPEEPTVVWHGRIPVSALISVGFQVGTLDPSATVEADVLIGQDGRARAIRPIGVN